MIMNYLVLLAVLPILAIAWFFAVLVIVLKHQARIFRLLENQTGCGPGTSAPKSLVELCREVERLAGSESSTEQWLDAAQKRWPLPPGDSGPK